MIIGFNQRDERLLQPIRDYGCLFLSLAYNSPVVYAYSRGITDLNMLWNKCLSRGYITGDLNHDGDVNDDGESEIMNHTYVAQLLGCEVVYDGVHHLPSETIPEDKVAFAIGAFHYKFTHFATVSKDDEHKVIWDSLGNSVSIAKGTLNSVRWYYHI